VFYTGAAPNQQAIPAVEYLMSEEGAPPSAGSCSAPTTFIRAPPTRSCVRSSRPRAWPRRTRGGYTPFGHSDYQTIVAERQEVFAGGKTAVVSTINGDSNVPFYKELGNAGLKPLTCR